MYWKVHQIILFTIKVQKVHDLKLSCTKKYYSQTFRNDKIMSCKNWKWDGCSTDYLREFFSVYISAWKKFCAGKYANSGSLGKFNGDRERDTPLLYEPVGWRLLMLVLNIIGFKIHNFLVLCENCSITRKFFQYFCGKMNFTVEKMNFTVEKNKFHSWKNEFHTWNMKSTYDTLEIWVHIATNEVRKKTVGMGG